jgi:hypothetical protein
MTPEQIIGDLFIQLQNVRAANARALQVFCALKTGEIQIEQLEITDDCIRVRSVEEMAAIEANRDAASRAKQNGAEQ